MLIYFYKWFASITRSTQTVYNVVWRNGTVNIDMIHISVGTIAHLLYIRMGMLLLYHFLSGFLIFTLSMWTHCSQQNNLHAAIDDLIRISFLLSIKMLKCMGHILHGNYI